MSKFWTIMLHTYFSKLKSKSFIITTIITLLLIYGFSNGPKIIEMFQSEEDQPNIAIVDETAGLYEPFAAQVKAMGDEIQLEPYTKTESAGEKEVKEGKYTGILVITQDDEGLPQGSYKAMQVAEQKVIGTLEQALQQLKVSVATNQLGLTQEQFSKMYEPVSFQTEALKENARTEEELNQARGLVYILLFVIYFSVIMYGNMIAMEVVTEKSSRVMEILISSVSPVKQMFGKILGIALLGLTQYLLIILVGYTALKQNLDDMQGGFFESFGLGDLPVETFIYAIIFFVLGYFFYATLAAMLGSLVSRVEDAQQVVTPMTFLIIAAFMIAMFGLGQPESPIITVTSFIPPFTPMIMFMRVGMLTIPVWEVIISIVLMVVTIVLLGFIGSKVYRGGVLLYGKSSSLKDIKKAIQLSKDS